MTTQPIAKGALLRRALLGNALFSGLSGLVLLVGFAPVGRLVGFELPWLYVALGMGLVLFALGLIRSARRPQINRAEARAASLMDAAWVLGSVALLLVPGLPLTMAGRWLIGLVADVVALFALLQWLGLRRAKSEA